MKILGSDVKTLADLSGDATKLIQDTQVYSVAAASTLNVAIAAGGVDTSNYPIVTPTTNYASLIYYATKPVQTVVHNVAYSGLYVLPSTVNYMSVIFQHQGTSPTNGTSIVISSANQVIYFTFSSSNYTGNISTGTYTRATLATAIAAAMTAAVANGWACVYNATDRRFEIAGTATFTLTFGTNSTNSAAITIGMPTVNQVSILGPTGAYNVYSLPIDVTMCVQAASGSTIWWRTNKIDNNIGVSNDGYLRLWRKGISIRLTTINGTAWMAEKVVMENTEKNSSIMGQFPDMSIVGRNTWVAVTSDTLVRGSFMPFSLNGYGYAADGYTTGGCTNVTQYNDSLNTWTAKTGDTAAARYNTAAFSLNGYGYVVDGSASTVVTQYNDSANTWAAKANDTAAARSAAVAFSLNGYGYAADGLTGSTLSTVTQYNDATNTWAAKTNDTVARYTLSSFSLGGYGYIVDGGTTASYTSTVTQYNDSANAWTAKANDTLARYVCSGFSINGYGYTIDGNNAGSTVISTVTQYN